MKEYSTSNVVATTIHYKLDGELGSVNVPSNQAAGEMKRLARCGAIIRGIVRDYDSDAVQNAVADGLLADIERAERDDSGRVDRSDLDQEMWDRANVQDRWDGGGL